ncbi:MAG: hypothetical protein JWO58_2152 [Chitinophagaceae bacterium]|nr:hypothetical protein [Chitinophagaceae bacterium]
MNLKEIRESGLLELYVYGSLENEELVLVVEALSKYPELKNDLEEIEMALLQHAELYAVEPHGIVKPFFLATLDYLERLKAGEIITSPPLVNKQSKISDYQQWLDRADMQVPEEMDAIHAKIIAHEPGKITALVWLRFGAPDEIHHDEYENFLIVEGSCTITVGDQEHHLKAGDYMSMPLHITHSVRITSPIPCKIILQRVAA